MKVAATPRASAVHPGPREHRLRLRVGPLRARLKTIIGPFRARAKTIFLVQFRARAERAMSYCWSICD